MAKGKIKLLWERMELDVKPLLDEQIYEGLMDLLDEAMIEAYNKGKRSVNYGKCKHFWDNNGRRNRPDGEPMFKERVKDGRE